MNINNKTNPLTGEHVVESIKPLDLSKFTKEELIEYFLNTYDSYETLFTSFKSDLNYYMCPDRLRLPLIFYYGHTAVVYMNKLILSNLLKPKDRVNFEYETIFETGVDEMSWDDIENYRMGKKYNWPKVEDVKEYRKNVRGKILNLIKNIEIKLPVTWDDQLWAIFMGFEHERIHFETSSVLIRQFPIDIVQRPANWKYGPFELEGDLAKIKNLMIKVPKTQVRIGKSFDFPSYGWDNEYGQVDCVVDEFEASKFKITNEEFMEFVLDNGYSEKKYWSNEGWKWVQFKQAKHPLFWICPFNCKSGCGTVLESYSHCLSDYFSKEEIESFRNKNSCLPFKFRLMFDIINMPSNWPVEVNYHEAKAFCNWKGDGFRVLTEAEHHAIRDTEIHDLNTINDPIYQVKSKKYNHNMLYGSSTPVNMFPANSKGFYDVFGNVWEWCEDNFNGLPGGKNHYLYDDFSTPCYDGRHNMIMGGSWASTGDEASKFARFMFRRHFYQHCGFRLARSLSNTNNSQVRLIQDRIYLLGGTYLDNETSLKGLNELNYYETTNKQYFYDSHLHPELFENELIKNFLNTNWVDTYTKSVIQLIDKFCVEKNSLLHLGCSTGNVTVQLAKHFNEVVAIDFCAKFIDFVEKVFKKNENNSNSCNKIVFKQLTWLPNEIKKSDLIFFSMINRCNTPKLWLKRMREIINLNGILIIDSENNKFDKEYLSEELEGFNLVYFTNSDTLRSSFSVWKLKN